LCGVWFSARVFIIEYIIELAIIHAWKRIIVPWQIGPNPVIGSSMKNLNCFKAGAIRAAYSRHVLRSMVDGFAPVSLRTFVGLVSSSYLGA
jgi:hypothetical protein